MDVVLSNNEVDQNVDFRISSKNVIRIWENRQTTQNKNKTHEFEKMETTLWSIHASAKISGMNF